MPDKWDKETEQDQKNSNNEMIIGLAVYYDVIRRMSKDIASSWRERSPDEDGNVWLQSNRRNQSLQRDVNEIRPEYVKADNYIGRRYRDEYNTKYYRNAYKTTQRFRKENFSVNINKYLNSQFEKAITNPLSKYMDPKLLQADRGKSLDGIYKVIRQGIIDGDSLQNINKNLDKQLGYRDKKTGKLFKNIEDYQGDFYKRMRVLRTEINRIRGQAETDEYKQEQAQGIGTDLVLVETIDDRTRRQSLQMDGQKADENGLFTYPDGRKAPRGSSGVARWDINDRSTTIQVLTEDDINDYARRENLSKKSTVIPYKEFSDYAKSKGMRRNRYGQWLFPKNET